jgi:AraC-like DNA-binding protein
LPLLYLGAWLAFSRAFKKATGLAPGSWREARRAAS